MTFYSSRRNIRHLEDADIVFQGLSNGDVSDVEDGMEDDEQTEIASEVSDSNDDDTDDGAAQEMSQVPTGQRKTISWSRKNSRHRPRNFVGSRMKIYAIMRPFLRPMNISPDTFPRACSVI